MSLADFARNTAAPKHHELPKDWQPTAEMTGDRGRAVIPMQVPLEGSDQDKEQQLLREAGFDPASYMITGDISYRKWMRYDQEWLHYYRFNVMRVSEAASELRSLSIDELMKVIRKPKPRTAPVAIAADCHAVVASDWQVGKGEGDGSAGTQRRVSDGIDLSVKRVKELRRIGRRMPHGAFLGTGDLVEGVCGFYCVAADTPILTSDMHWVPAGSLSVGDGLYGIEEEPATTAGRKYVPSEVVHHTVVQRPVVRVYMSNGDSMLCTPEHPFLARPVRQYGGNCSYRWVRADELMLRPYEVAKMFNTWETGESYEHGWLAGLFDGEGCFSGHTSRGANNMLSVTQLPGPILDQAKDLLERFKFSYAESVHPDSGVHTLRITGGYAETLRLLGTIQPGRLVAKVGHPHARTMESPRVMAVKPAGTHEIAIMGTTSKTYFANGYVAHNSNQPYLIDLNDREQARNVAALLTYGIEELSPLFETFLVATSLDNHGQKRQDGKVVTDLADNKTAECYDRVKEAFDRDARYDNLHWVIPDGETSVLVELGGVPVGLTHGDLFYGGGKMPQAKALEWWKGQDFGMQPLRGAKILMSGHFHHYSCVMHGSRTHFQAPAMDPGSDWFKNSSGYDSPPGMLTLRFDSELRYGWADEAILLG